MFRCHRGRFKAWDNWTWVQGLDKDSHLVLDLASLKRPPVGVVWELGEGVPAQVSSTSLDHGSKLRGPSPKALV
ncbi:hypothetical protein TNCV_2209821 [Trichonephila clavipes]|nr:hypothetical protein TNCV_2209821 [Trichonephila clavipes]